MPPLIVRAPPELLFVATALFSLHDVMNDTRGAEVLIVLCTSAQLRLITLAVTPVEVFPSIPTVPDLVEVGAEVASVAVGA